MELYGPGHQFHCDTRAEFYLSGLHFTSVTHYLHYKKAIVFENDKIARMILETDDIIIQAQLAAQIRRFCQRAWKELCLKAFFDGTIAKFEHHSDLKDALLEKTGTLFVQAGQYDSVWGNGLRPDDPDNHNLSAWRGSNWGGYLLTEVREHLLAKPGVAATPYQISWTWDDLREDKKSEYTAVDRMEKYSLAVVMDQIIRTDCKKPSRKRKRARAASKYIDSGFSF